MSKKNTLAKLKQRLQIDQDKMDKYLDHYYNGTALDAEGMTMLERYRKAWSWLSLGRTYDVTLSMLMKDYGLAERQGRYIIAEAVYLHGNVAQLDRAGKKVASANFFRLVANLALSGQDYDAATRAWEKADRLEGLHEADAPPGWDPDAFSKPGKFVFINNVNILKQQQQPRELDE